MAKKKGPNGRDYAQEEKLNNTPAQRKVQALRMRARRKAEKEGKVHPHDNKQVDHIKFASQGGTNAPGNVRVVPKHENEIRQPKRKGKKKK